MSYEGPNTSHLAKALQLHAIKTDRKLITRPDKKLPNDFTPDENLFNNKRTLFPCGDELDMGTPAITVEAVEQVEIDQPVIEQPPLNDTAAHQTVTSQPTAELPSVRQAEQATYRVIPLPAPGKTIVIEDQSTAFETNKNRIRPGMFHIADLIVTSKKRGVNQNNPQIVHKPGPYSVQLEYQSKIPSSKKYVIQINLLDYGHTTANFDYKLQVIIHHSDTWKRDTTIEKEVQSLQIANGDNLQALKVFAGTEMDSTYTVRKITLFPNDASYTQTPTILPYGCGIDLIPLNTINQRYFKCIKFTVLNGCSESKEYVIFRVRRSNRDIYCVRRIEGNKLILCDDINKQSINQLLLYPNQEFKINADVWTIPENGISSYVIDRKSLQVIDETSEIK